MRAVRTIVAGLLLGVLLAMLGPAAPAAAHAYLLSSDPLNGAILNDPPTTVTLEFSEPVRAVPDRVIVVAPDGERVEAGEPRVEGSRLIIPLERTTAAFGTYLVSYRVVSQDSHPVAGGITYSVGAPSAVPPTVPDDDPADPVVAVAMSTVKYVGYAGLMLLVGVVLVVGLLWPRRLSRRRPARLAWAGVGLFGAATVAGLWVQAPYATGATLFGANGRALQDVLASPYGTAHVVRLGVLVAVAVLLRPLLSGRGGASDLWLLAALGAVGLGTWPVAGHPIASPIPLVSIAVGTAHLGALTIWAGGLVMLAGFLLRSANERELAAILPAWSRWAAAAVAVLLVTGLVQAVIEIGPPEALVTTSYGRLLLVKVGLFSLVIATAAYSRQLVRTRLAPRRPGALRVAVVAETVVLAAVLVVAAMLVQTTPGRTEAAGGQQVSATDFYATLDSDLYSLQVIVEPAAQGINQVHLYAYTPDGQPQVVEEWTVTAALPEAGVEQLDVPLTVLTDSHAIGQVTLPSAGEWELAFTLRLSEIEQATVRATVPIS